jgi:hypothetical protein
MSRYFPSVLVVLFSTATPVLSQQIEWKIHRLTR